jgi:predicted RNA binding protein YcfA (HicA-like mRNA interferase family)
MRKFPSIKRRRMLRILSSNPLNYIAARNSKGSHLMLVSPGRQPILFHYHPKIEISGRIVREILVDKAGLSEEQAWKLIH